MKEFLSGFVAIIGSPNVGKSTLMNNMIGQKISIVSDKAQTTRNRLHGVLTKDDYQIIFIDTPGIQAPRNKLGDYMLRSAYEALEDVDAVLFVVDALKGMGARDLSILERLLGAAPIIIAVNKKDAVNDATLLSVLASLNSYDKLDAVIPISALEGDGVETLEKRLVKHLKPGPKYYPDDMITDQPERVIAAEIIREKALICLRDEVPHGVGVEIMSISKPEETSLLSISATIYCERASHKSIIIGNQGSMLKKIGTAARYDLQRLFGEK
ncbi:MAG: GTPase Era, partial [Christensenellales bacterium]